MKLDMRYRASTLRPRRFADSMRSGSRSRLGAVCVAYLVVSLQMLACRSRTLCGRRDESGGRSVSGLQRLGGIRTGFELELRCDPRVLRGAGYGPVAWRKDLSPHPLADDQLVFAQPACELQAALTVLAQRRKSAAAQDAPLLCATTKECLRRVFSRHQR
jgi:hypothetical protein